MRKSAHFPESMQSFSGDQYNKQKIEIQCCEIDAAQTKSDAGISLMV